MTERYGLTMPSDYLENYWKLELLGSVSVANLRKIAKTITRVRLGFMQNCYRAEVTIPKAHLWAAFKDRRTVTVCIYGKFWRPYPDSSPTHWNYCRHLYIGELPNSSR